MISSYVSFMWWEIWEWKLANLTSTADSVPQITYTYETKRAGKVWPLSHWTKGIRRADSLTYWIGGSEF